MNTPIKKLCPKCQEIVRKADAKFMRNYRAKKVGQGKAKIKSRNKQNEFNILSAKQKTSPNS